MTVIGVVGAVVAAESNSIWIRLEGILLVVIGLSGAISSYIERSNGRRTVGRGFRRPCWARDRIVERISYTSVAAIVIVTAMHTYRDHQWDACASAIALGGAVFWAVRSDRQADRARAPVDDAEIRSVE